MPLTLLLKAIGVTVAPEQMVCDNGVADVTGRGFTTAVVIIGAPVQPPTRVIVNVTVTGAVVVFVKVPLIFPDPLAAIPVTDAVLFLVQLYVAPPTLLLIAIGVMAPEQIVCEEGVAEVTCAGFTITVAVIGPAVQLLGVIVNVTVTGEEVVLVNAPVMLPDPLAAIPVTKAVLFLVQV